MSEPHSSTPMIVPPVSPVLPSAPPNRAQPWPTGTTVQSLAYTSDRPAGGRVVCELPAALNRRAVALPVSAGEPAVELLSIPSDATDDAALLAQLREWVTGPGGAVNSAQMMTFQGAQLFWGPKRAAVVAPADRLPPLEAVLAEVAYYEGELVEVERVIATAWPELEADAGPAFEIDAKSIRQQARIAARFRQLLGLRARLTRVIPHVLAPHVYPPTLATQVSERLRERLRLRHRVEMLQEQLEVFERIYDACGHKVSEYKASRKGHLLEMIIIVFLAAQTLLVMFEILTNSGRYAMPTTPAATSPK